MATTYTLFMKESNKEKYLWVARCHIKKYVLIKQSTIKRLTRSLSWPIAFNPSDVTVKNKRKFSGWVHWNARSLWLYFITTYTDTFQISSTEANYVIFIVFKHQDVLTGIVTVCFSTVQAISFEAFPLSFSVFHFISNHYSDMILLSAY